MKDKICIGVDVGGTSVKLGAFTKEGMMLKKWEIKTDKTNHSENLIRDIADSIREELGKEGMTTEDLLGVGMGVPGPVLSDGYVEVCVNLGWKEGRYPARELSDKLDGVPAKLSNDANIAALGETWQGGAKGYSDVVLLTLGTGVGGGIVLGQKIVAGNHGLGGEIGHIFMYEGEEEECNCGNHGCLEQVASATGITRWAKRAMKSSEKQSSMREFGDRITAKDVLDCAKAGDELATEVMDKVCKYLGIAIAHASYIVDPEVFVIGGGVSKAGSYLTDKITKQYHKYAKLSKSYSPVVLATLGNDAGIYGAARMTLNI